MNIKINNTQNTVYSGLIYGGKFPIFIDLSINIDNSKKHGEFIVSDNHSKLLELNLEQAKELYTFLKLIF